MDQQSRNADFGWNIDLIIILFHNWVFIFLLIGACLGRKSNVFHAYMPDYLGTSNTCQADHSFPTMWLFIYNKSW